MELDELFVPVASWENYSISNYGRVVRTKTGRELMQRQEISSGRLKVRFSEMGVRKEFYVDNLVAEAFFLNYHDGIDIYYKNRNKFDCTVRNLTFDSKYKDDS